MSSIQFKGSSDLILCVGGPTFKQNDVRFVRPKTLLNEVESLYEVKYLNSYPKPNGFFQEKVVRQQSNEGGSPHLTIRHRDRKIIKDANNLILNIIKKGNSTTKPEKEAYKEFLNKWLLSFYKISEEYNR